MEYNNKKEYINKKKELYSCPRLKCTEIKRKYEIRIEGRWIRLFCGKCSHKIINFNNINEMYKFLLFINSLIKDKTREVFVFNYRKNIKKPNAKYKWLNWYDRFINKESEE